MAKQKIVAGGMIEVATPAEMDQKFFALHERLNKYEEMAARGVRRVQATSDPVTITGAIQGVGGASGIQCPESGMCWAVHRISMQDVTNSAYAAEIYKTGSDITNTTAMPSRSKFVENMACGTTAGAANPCAVFFSKGGLTLYEQEFVGIVVPAGLTPGSVVQFVVEGFEVPRSLMWKLVL